MNFYYLFRTNGMQANLNPLFNNSWGREMWLIPTHISWLNWAFFTSECRRDRTYSSTSKCTLTNIYYWVHELTAFLILELLNHVLKKYFQPLIVFKYFQFLEFCLYNRLQGWIWEYKYSDAYNTGMHLRNVNYISIRNCTSHIK